MNARWYARHSWLYEALALILFYAALLLLVNR